MRNTHTRRLGVSAAQAGIWLDRLATDDDPLWPAPAWPALRLDGPLGVGADGGHGPIRYRVAEYEPGRRVRFRFAAHLGVQGWHELRVEPAGQHCRLVHELVGTPRGSMRLGWPLAVRWLHDALIEDLLDNAAQLAGQERRARWSPWVRMVRARIGPRTRTTAVPPAVRRIYPHADLADAYSVPTSVAADPQTWADAVFRSAPFWVVGLLGIRNALVKLVGIEHGGRSSFDTRSVDGNQLVLGTDAGHLDFRAGVTVAERAVTISTVARTNNRRGRFYLLFVRIVHPFVVRSMLRGAARRMARRAPTAADREAARVAT